MRIYNIETKKVEPFINKLSNPLWKENISVWQSCIKNDGNQSVYFLKDIPLMEYFKGIVSSLKYLPKSTNQLIIDVIDGNKSKAELFAFCPATFNADKETGDNSGEIEPPFRTKLSHPVLILQC